MDSVSDESLMIRSGSVRLSEETARGRAVSRSVSFEATSRVAAREVTPDQRLSHRVEQSGAAFGI